MKRDPRVHNPLRDPRRGDLVRKLTDPVLLIVCERYVTERSGDVVQYRSSGSTKDRRTTLAMWRRWAKGAEVLNAAE